MSKVDEEQFEPFEAENISVTRAGRSQAPGTTNGNQGQGGMGVLATVLVLFLIVITAGISFLIYMTLGNETKYDAMEKQLIALEARLPNTGQQVTENQSELLEPVTSSTAASQSATATEPSGNVTAANPNGTQTYIVQSGDTLSTIATINGMTLEDLRSLNNVADDNVYVGQELAVTKSATE